MRVATTTIGDAIVMLREAMVQVAKARMAIQAAVDAVADAEYEYNVKRSSTFIEHEGSEAMKREHARLVSAEAKRELDKAKGRKDTAVTASEDAKAILSACQSLGGLVKAVVSWERGP